MQQIARQIHAELAKAKKIVIVPHQHPDADALGSATALFEYLQNIGKEVHIFCATIATPKLNFLSHSQHLATDPAVFSHRPSDVIVVVDSGDLRYAGVDKHLKETSAVIINIDHHITNEHFGRINLVLPAASSTSEIIYHFFKHNHIAVNARMATSLLAGLLTDTGNFTNAATSSNALNVAGELLRAGGDYTLVNNAVVRNKTIPILKLWGVALARLTKHEPLNLTYTYITQKDLTDHNLPDSETEGVANFLNNLENTDIALILKEQTDGQIKGSLRTTKDNVDVAALAKKLGGGGHKKAAGFSLPGTIDEVLGKILTKN